MNRPKRQQGETRHLLACLALAFAPMLANALSGGEGLEGTPHDFTWHGTGDLKSQKAGLCTYCHTPQFTRGNLLLWDGTRTANSFRWDVTTTAAGTPLLGFTGSTYRGTSVRCLSCHDGSVAMGDASFGGAQDASGPRMTDFPAKFQVGVAGNLSGNHPIGVPYPMGRVPNRYNGTTNGGLGGGFLATEWQPNPTASGITNIRLYQQDATGGISVVPSGVVSSTAGIECSSCHDPHNKASVDDLFLRGKRYGRSQADGYLCEQCHNM